MKTKITTSSVIAHPGQECQWKPHQDIHTFQICALCGRVRNVPFAWTKYDELEAEFMGHQEESLPTAMVRA
jgi:hypothetical protein